LSCSSSRVPREFEGRTLQMGARRSIGLKRNGLPSRHAQRNAQRARWRHRALSLGARRQRRTGYSANRQKPGIVMGTYAEALAEYYNGEVLGEAAYSSMLSAAKTDDQRLKLATLLQLETETKAWLRPHVLAHGVSCVERTEDRERGTRLVAAFASMSWTETW